MSPSAQRAQLDFVRLVAEEPSSLYFEQFLRDGFDAWPASYRRRFPGLQTWPGVAGLKQSLRRLANAPQDWQVLLASRSLSLVHLATQRLFRVCKRVLSTDLSWPTYQTTLERNAAGTGNQVIGVPLRDEILQCGWSVEDVSDYLAEQFVIHRCDGLFLPAVDHLGIRLPVRRIVEQIRRRSGLKFVLIDAAQAFCHVPLDDCLTVADFVVAGSHKWMQAYLPTGIGFHRLHQQPDLSDSRSQTWETDDRWRDPLLRFTDQIDSDRLDSHSETANVANIIACAGAANDALELSQIKTRDFSLPKNDQLSPDFPGCWRLVSPETSMRSRITLFQSDDLWIRRLSKDELRKHWMICGFVISAYSEGLIRISIPP